VPAETAIAALETFSGLERRLEIKGNVGGVLVVDDYAHHPSEIRVSLEALRGRFPDRRLLLVFQPHTYSRTADLFDDFATVLCLADRTFVMDIYPARETSTLGMHSRHLAEAAAPRGGVIYSGSHQMTVEMVLRELRPGDMVVTMGAGDVNEVATRLLTERGFHETSNASGVRRVDTEAGRTGHEAVPPGHDGPGTVECHAIGQSPGLEAEVVRALDAAGVKRASAEEPMSRHTSWRIGGPADYLCTVEDQGQLRAAIGVANDYGFPWLVIGGGNNILVSDDGVEGVVILNRLRGISLQRSSDNGHAELTCGAGVFFAKAARFSAQRDFTGMEWGIAVPGTVGGGVVNNAGAHASDVARSLVWTEVLDAQGREERLDPRQLDYRYRRSTLKTQVTARSEMVVTSCGFRVDPDQPGAALSRLEKFRRHRIQTQPVKEASAGSSFTNPEGDYAGSLIDRAGLKGHRIGGAQISSLHANFILNVGQASASDVVQLLLLSRRTVIERFGITLVPEVQLAGRWSSEVVASFSEPVS
jgi:UDP-N-acetylmuramate dehydrogenase